MRLAHAVLVLGVSMGGGSAAEAQAAQGAAGLAAAPSTRATAEVTLNLALGQAPAGAPPLVIRLDYGQPHLRGRQLHTETLVPYDQVWRMGANNATTLRTDVDLTIGGARVAKGTYVVVALPARSGWKLILQREGAPAANEYNASFDVARIDLRRTTLTSPVESFSMWLIPGTGDASARGELRFAWGTVQLATDWAVR